MYPVTLHEWLDYWRELYFRPNVAPSTYENSHFNLQILKNNIPNYQLDEMTLPMVQKFLNNLRDDGYAKDTIKKVSSYLRRSLEKAICHHIISSNPAIGSVIPKKATKKKVRALTQDQQRAVCVFCKSVLYGEYMEFLFLTGLRVGEFCKICWADYSLHDGVLSIPDSKTEAGIRLIPLVNRAREILESQTRCKSDNYVFHNKQGKPVTYSSMKKCYEKLRKKTGFIDFTNYVCRHSFATRLLEKGATPKGVATLLGHNSVEFCMDVYTDIEKAMAMKDIYLLEKPDESAKAIDIMVAIQKLKANNNGILPKELIQALMAV